MADPEPRIRLSSAEIAPGESITVRTLISHPMESGHRRDADGALIPQNIIRTFTCLFEGAVLFRCELEPAMAANPYLEFTVAPDRSGVLTFTWIGDGGLEVTATEAVVVG